MASAPGGQVRGDHDGALFEARHDELEEQVRGVLIEWDVGDLVDDDQLVAADLLELGCQPVGLMRGGEAGDPLLAVSNSTECPASVALTPRPMARCVRGTNQRWARA